MQLINNNIGLNCVDSRANVKAWLGVIKPSILKMPFRFDDIPYFDTSYMCDPLIKPGVSMEKEESWDTPFKWRNTVSNQITKSVQTCDEPKLPLVYADPYLVHYMKPPEQQIYEDKLIHLPYNRDPMVTPPILPSNILDPRYESTSSFYHQNYNQNQYYSYDHYNQNYNYSNYSQNQSHYRQEDFNRNPNIYSRESPPNKSYNGRNVYNEPNKPGYCDTPPPPPVNRRFQQMHDNYSSNNNNNRHENKYNTNCNTKLANKDFEYIKSPPTSLNKTKPANPIAELENKCRKTTATSDDDPPFNFQGMLRKTNYNRGSLKRTIDNVRRFSLKSRQNDNDCNDEKNVIFNSKSNLRDSTSVDSFGKNISTEVAPGIIMEGMVADL